MNDKFNKITNEMFIQAFNESISKEDIFKKLNISSGGNSTKFVNKMIEKLNLSLDILKQNRFNKYHLKKTCPVCGKEFYTNTGKKLEIKYVVRILVQILILEVAKIMECIKIVNLKENVLM